MVSERQLPCTRIPLQTPSASGTPPPIPPARHSHLTLPSYWPPLILSPFPSLCKMISRKHILPLSLGGSGDRSGRAERSGRSSPPPPPRLLLGPSEPLSPEALRKTSRHVEGSRGALRLLLVITPGGTRGQPGAMQGTQKPGNGTPQSPFPCLCSERQKALRGTLCSGVCLVVFVFFCSLCIFCHLTARLQLIRPVSARDPTGSLHIFSEAFVSTPPLLSSPPLSHLKRQERKGRGPVVA